MAKAFYCPVSPHIPWFWGLTYKECPCAGNERNMEECRLCHLRGAGAKVPVVERPVREKPRQRRDAKPRRPAGIGTHQKREETK